MVEHGPSPVANVARIMGLTRQSVQQTADSLAEDGLIEYMENPHHRRAKLMVMTPKGRKALDYVVERHAEWANQIGRKHSLEGLKLPSESCNSSEKAWSSTRRSPQKKTFERVGNYLFT